MTETFVAVYTVRIGNGKQQTAEDTVTTAPLPLKYITQQW